MSTPAGGDAFLHELELDVRIELIQAENSQLEERADGVPAVESFDEEAQRYEVSLHALLCAIEAVEDESPVRQPLPRPGTGC